MSDSTMTRDELVEELRWLRLRVGELEGEQASRHQAEQAPQSDERAREATLDSLLEHVVRQDREMRIVWANQAACESAGMTREQLIGRGCYEIWGQGSGPCPDCPVTEAVRTGKPCDRERTTPDGRTWYIRGYPVRGEDGSITGAVEITLDVTERKRAEEELRTAQGLLAAAIEQTPAGVLVAEAPDVNIRLANAAALGIRGETRRPLTNIPVSFHSDYWQTFYPDGRPYDPKDLPLSRAILRGESCHDVEVIIQRESGERRWVSANSAPVRDAEGNIVAGVVVFPDITERKQAEEELAGHREHLEELVEQRTRELEESREKLAQSERLAAVGTLAAGIAHEINNPVGGILLAAQGALNSGEVPASLSGCLGDIIGHAQRCKTIIQNVRRFARPEGTAKSPGDLNAVAERAVELTRKYAGKSDCAVSCELATGLPRPAMNPTAMEQVAVNLIRNGIEAGANRVVVRTELAGPAVQLIVQDNGAGVSGEQAKHVFEPFYSTRQASGGTGLGLSIAHGIVRDHQGSIDIISEPGQGATFTVSLPARPSLQDEGAEDG